MRTPMNQSNVYNQHILSCIYQKSVQIKVYKPNHYSPHYKMLYKSHGENLTQTPTTAIKKSTIKLS